MSRKTPIDYHLKELEIARNPESPRHIMPRFSPDDHAILDIGCGIGQTLVAASVADGALLVGLDVDLGGLVYGKAHFGHVHYVNGTAERLPLRDGSFDLVISRVSLPYTNIPEALAEIRRVLRDGGRVWFTLHAFSLTVKQLRDSVRDLSVKGVLFRMYVIANGLLFHLFGTLLAVPLYGIYESFQTESAMARAMKNAGLGDVVIRTEGRHLVVTAQKRA